MQRASYGFALAGRHYLSALQEQKRFDNRGARPLRLQCVPLSVFGNERHNLSRQPSAALRRIQSSNDFMGKWVHGSVHEGVSAADLEHLGALKLHDAPAHCNGVKHEQWVSLKNKNKVPHLATNGEIGTRQGGGDMTIPTATIVNITKGFGKNCNA